jgi:phytoene synthase
VELAATHWEDRLIDEATAALSDRQRRSAAPPETPALAAAYKACAAITSANSRTFYLASALLPRRKCRAMRALYAYCRTTDDIVDRPGPDAPQELEQWRRLTLDDRRAGDDPVGLAWAHIQAEYRIPLAYAERLIEGAQQDLRRGRYATFADLAEYCYSVASTVGLMAMHITGFSGPQAVPYAVRLGVALQMTNILRDVAEDWSRGRLYLPLDELASFGLEAADVAEGVVDDRWRAFMRLQIDRNRQLYDRAVPGISLLHRDGQVAVAAAAQLYAAILDDIEAHDYDVFNRRAHLSGCAKLRRLPGVWLDVQRLRRRPV